MLFGTNRTAFLGESAINVDENYFGAGAYDFAQEAAQDELNIFEMAIKCDIDEALCEESSEIEALYEGFIENAKKQIVDMMEKFKQWIASMLRTVIAKLNQWLTVDNAKFVTNARKAINKLAKKDFKAESVKVVDNSKINSLIDDLTNASEFNKWTSKDTCTESEVSDAKKLLEDIKSKSSSKLCEECTKTQDITMSDVDKALDWLGSAGNKQIKKLKEGLNKDISTANKIIKDSKKAEKAEKTEDKQKGIHNKVEVVKLYKEYVQTSKKLATKLISYASRVNRAVAAKAMVGSVKEGYESEELMIASLEASEYELESSMEEMSEACKKETCDDDEDDEDED